MSANATTVKTTAAAVPKKTAVAATTAPKKAVATAAPKKAEAATTTAEATPVAKSAAAITKTAAAAAAAAAKRRGPGRPPSKPPAPQLVMHGIVDSPEDANNRLEVVIGTPGIIKELFTYFKNIKARDIHIKCEPTSMTLYTRDHSRTSRVIATIAGENTHWFYCEYEFWLQLNRETVEKMFSTVDKTFYKITILQSHDAINSIDFVLKDSEVEKECHHRFDLSEHTTDVDLYDAEKILSPSVLASEFPIIFTLSAKQFKKTTTDICAFSENAQIEKIGEEPLQFTYDKTGHAYHEVYRSDEKIKLESTVAKGDTFRVSVKMSNLKSLAHSMVAQDVRIYCREDGDILFRSALDDRALVVSTVVKRDSDS